MRKHIKVYCNSENSQCRKNSLKLIEYLIKRQVCFEVVPRDRYPYIVISEGVREDYYYPENLSNSDPRAKRLDDAIKEIKENMHAQRHN